MKINKKLNQIMKYNFLRLNKIIKTKNKNSKPNFQIY